MNYYHIACKYVTPLFRMFHNYQIYGAEYLREAANNGRIVICTTHSSDFGGMIVGMAVSSVLNIDPFIVINRKYRANPFTNFFLKSMNIIWIMGNDMLGNYPALKEIRGILTRPGSDVIIIAPQGVYNKPNPADVKFRQGFAIPCVQAANAGVAISIVPAVDVGATYKGMPSIGRRIAAVFGKPVRVERRAKRAQLTEQVEKAVKLLIKEGQATFRDCC